VTLSGALEAGYSNALVDQLDSGDVAGIYFKPDGTKVF
jgi:hypothetical protein